MGRVWRVASVFVPSLAAVLLAIGPTRAGRQELHVAGLVLAGIWIAMAIALWMRYRQARRGEGIGWPQLDILSATGRATAWTALAAILLALATKWASLSVLGILGLGVVCLSTLWTVMVAGGDAPWRRATVTRTIAPEIGVEGEPLREKVRFEGVRIPVAMRLFASGRATRFGRVSRYVVGSDASNATVELEAELGPGTRGEHRAPPLALWLGDVLGLTHTPKIERGETTFTVTPRAAKVDSIEELKGDGRDDMKARETIKMPTEGTFRIREYTPGDDTRRIHWVRSLQMDQLVVRLPDEIPPADPVARVVLDNHFAGTDQLGTRAPDELLDAMVRVWLGVARALADAGTRVSLVTAVEKGGVHARAERPLLARTSSEANKFAARVTWQPNVRLDALLDKRPIRQIVVSCRPRTTYIAALDNAVDWVVVPHNDWTSPEQWPSPVSAVKLPFPAGSAENRGRRRRLERQRLQTSWQDRSLFAHLCNVDWKRYSGAVVARPSYATGGILLQVIP